MATSKDYLDYLLEQLGEGITVKKMFGEYGLYFQEKFIACVCDNQYFVKITPAGEALLPGAEKAPPYAGGSDYFLIHDPEDRPLMRRLLEETAAALPMPRPKKPKAPKKDTKK